jgi:Flp pilus assembly pilin Flp
MSCRLSIAQGGGRYFLGVDKAMAGVFVFFKEFSRDERGAAAAEYALLLAIIAAGMAAAISNAMDNASNCINEGPNCTP